MPPLCQPGPHAGLIPPRPVAFRRASRRAIDGRRGDAVEQHRHDDREGDRRPQPRLVGHVLVAHGVGQVVQRADAADAEERDGRHLAAVEPAVEASSSRAQHAPARRSRRAGARRARARGPRRRRASRGARAGPRVIAMPEDQQHQQGHQPLEPLDDAVHRALVGVAALGGAQPHRAHEDRQEAVAADQLRGAVRRQQRGQRQQRLARGRPAAACRCGRGRPGGPAASRRPGRPRRRARSCRRRTSRATSPASASAEAAGQQQQGEVHEREGEPVVEPGLGGEREPDVVVLVAAPRRRSSPSAVDVLGERLAHLHVGGQHRVGRGEHGAEQQRDRRRQPGDPPAEQRDAEDGQRHGDQQQPPHRRPGAPRPPRPQVERAVDGQADAHQRDQHGELGDVGDEVAVVLRVEADRRRRAAAGRWPCRRRRAPSAGTAAMRRVSWGRTIARSRDRPRRR